MNVKALEKLVRGIMRGDNVEGMARAMLRTNAITGVEHRSLQVVAPGGYNGAVGAAVARPMHSDTVSLWA